MGEGREEKSDEWRATRL